MYQAFKDMPKLLKFITAHAFFCAVFFLAVVIPGIPIRFNGQLMESSDLWKSGLALPTAAVGLAMPLAGVLLLRRWQYARYLYVLFFVSLLIAPYLYWHQLVQALFGTALSCGVIGYLFINKAVRAYFNS